MSLFESSLNILLINEHPDEIKLVTSSLRGFFSGCRIEAGYSSEDALAFSHQGEWQIILIDQDLSPEQGLDILTRLRRNAPSAAIILQTNESDSHTAVQALQNGADFLLFKRSPGFITELLFSVQEAVEKRSLQMKLDHTFQRYQRFIETLNDLAYELDQDGRFTYVGAAVTAMLGYTPEELAGRHYSLLLPPLLETTGRFRLNERRAGSRSIRRLELTLHRKGLADGPGTAITVEVTAKGLFDSANRYLGTVGVLRDRSQEKAQQDRLAELEARLQETDRQLTLSREAVRVSRQLQQPLTTLLQDSQRLLSTIQHSKIEQHAETMVAKASQASRLGNQLAQAIHAHPSEFAPLDLNGIIQTIVPTVLRETEGSGLLVTTHFAENLPLMLGSPDALEKLLRILLDYAHRYTSEPLMPAHLILQTESRTPPDLAPIRSDTALESNASHPCASFSIRAATRHTVSAVHEQPDFHVSPEEFFQAHQIVQAHGGAIEIEHAVESGLTITVRFPALSKRSAASMTGEHPESVTAPLPSAETDIVHTRAEHGAGQRPDRRRSERKLFSLPVRLSIGGETLRGVLRNMSTGGALLTVHDLSTTVHLQPAYVVIKTPVSFLELQGIVHERSSSLVDLRLPAVKDFVISFSSSGERDRNVLRSLLDGLQDGSTTVTFESLILPLFATPERSPADPLSSIAVPADRREGIRLNVSCPIRLIGSPATPARPLGLLLNLSLEGACIDLPEEADSFEVQQVLRMVPIEPINPSTEASQPDGSEDPWSARILWTHRHRARGTSRLTPAEDGRRHVGVRFEPLSPAQEHRLRSLIAPRIGTSQDLAEPTTDSHVRTVSHILRNREGHRIVLCHDSPSRAESKQRPLILLCPGYGTTQLAYVAFAYALTGYGLQVLRYDHSRHIGLSDGDPSHTTFTSMEDDLDTVLVFAQKECPGATLTILAPDLLARIALRRQDWHKRIRRLLLLNPTLDLRHCLTMLHQRDLVQEHLAGTRLGLGNLLGIPLDIDHFLADAVAAQYTEVSALHEDLTHCGTDVAFLVTSPGALACPIPSPAPTLLDDVSNRLGPRSSRVSLPSPLLTSDNLSSTSLRASWQRIAQLCLTPDTFPHPIASPRQDLSRVTSIRARFERDQLRIKYAAGTAGRERLWAAQTGLTRTFDELPAHWQYVDQLYQLLQPLDGGLALLDVGCGIHSFARLLLLNLAYRLRAQTWRPNQPLRYVGMDYSVAALHATQVATRDALKHVDQLFSGRISGPTPVTQQWVLGRSVETLPFADHSFDCIVASLSLSFSRSPLHALRELFRVLRPGGRLIVSAVTPSADIALLYRPRLQELGLDAFTGDARLALNRMAQCCVALRIGQLHAFQEDSLADRLSQITPIPARLVRALSGQILLAAAEKPDSSG
ncbi:MAG: methyltransferase domain-containing protein [Nitrospira sp.]|nr:methyltransferase domain-containing protein [Nitrospira sp.]